MTEMEQVIQLFEERVLAQEMDDPQQRDAIIRMLVFYLLSV